jgi:hypothetical protein
MDRVSVSGREAGMVGSVMRLTVGEGAARFAGGERGD